MDVKLAFALLILQVAASSTHFFHRESSDEKSEETKITDLLSIVNDDSVEPHDERTKLVRLLPLSSEERYSKYAKKWNQRKQLRRKSKKPLAFILAASDLKHNKYSRRLLEAGKKGNKGVKVVYKNDLVEDSSEENLSAKFSKENDSTELSKEFELTELIKEGLSKESSLQDLSNDKNVETLSNELSTKHSFKYSSKEYVSKQLSEEDLPRKGEFDEINASNDLTKDLLDKESISEENQYSYKAKESDTDISNEETILNISTIEKLAKEKFDDDKHSDNLLDTVNVSLEKADAHHNVHHVIHTNVSPAVSVSLENSPEKDVASENSNEEKLIADKNPDTLTSVIELSKDFLGHSNEETMDKEARSAKEPSILAKNEKEIVLVSSDNIDARSNTIAADLFRNKLKRTGKLHKSYNLSFLFNKK